MSEPHREHSQSRSDRPGDPPERDPGAHSRGPGRFWEQYGEARRHGSGNGHRPSDEGTHAEPRPLASESGGHECLEWCPICRGADVVRATAPPEVREQLETLQRDALALIRAVIDGYIARQAETRAPGAPDDRVEDIPIR